MREQVDFTGVESTMLVTLYLKALESRSPDSILADHFAAEAVDRIDYDFAGLVPRAGLGNRFMVALRAKQLDDWAADFVRRQPNATVLHLGCGLDSRAFRLGPPPGVGWYDVDLPEVIELRRKLYPAPDGYHLIGSSVTDPAWLAELPTDGPALIIAEGLFMYLTPDSVERLLVEFTDRFVAGELLCDGFAPWVVRTTQRLSKPMARKGYPPYTMAMRDGREIEDRTAGVKLVERVPIVSGGPKIPARGYRVTYQLMNLIPATRDFYQAFRFAF